MFTVDNDQLPIFSDKSVKCDYNAIDLSLRNVYKYLQNANKQSAAGPDGYPGLIWSNLASFLALPLIHLMFHLSLTYYHLSRNYLIYLIYIKKG